MPWLSFVKLSDLSLLFQRVFLQVAKGVAPKRELVNKLQQKKEEAEEHLGFPNCVFLEKVIRRHKKASKLYVVSVHLIQQFLSLKILRKLTVARQELILAEIHLDWKVLD